MNTRRSELWSLLGDLPTNFLPRGERAAVKRVDGATVEQWTLSLNGVEDVPALLVLPDVRHENKPAVIYAHMHAGDHTMGKEELFEGVSGIISPYAPDLIDMGVVVLAIDSWCFGERQINPDGVEGERETFSKMLWSGQVLFGMMLFDLQQALSWLLQRDDVELVGTMGMSMGATQSWWLAALDERISFCLDICCLTDFETLVEKGSIGLHSIYYFVPSLLKHFSSGEINALIAPRPRLSLNGLHDPWSPSEGVEKIARALQTAYANVPQNLRIETFDVGHEESPEMRAVARQWLRSQIDHA